MQECTFDNIAQKKLKISKNFRSSNENINDIVFLSKNDSLKTFFWIRRMQFPQTWCKRLDNILQVFCSSSRRIELSKNLPRNNFTSKTSCAHVESSFDNMRKSFCKQSKSFYSKFQKNRKTLFYFQTFSPKASHRHVECNFDESADVFFQKTECILLKVKRKNRF